MDTPHCTCTSDALWRVVAALAGVAWPPEGEAQNRRFGHEAMQQFLLPLLLKSGHATPAEFHVLERANAERQNILRDEMHRFAARMHDRPFVVLKGWDYAFRLYGDIHLRPMADLDVFVPAANLHATAARLEQNGMRRIRQPGHRGQDVHYEYVFVTDRAMVEVHQGFTQAQRHTIDYGEVWARRVPFPYDGFPPTVSRLSDADAIAYHALSMGTEEFSVRLIRYVDLRLLIEANPRALDDAAAIAKQWRARRMLYGALRTTAMLFPDIASDAYLHVMHSILPRSTRRALDHYVLPDPTRERGGHISGRLRQLWRKFWLIDNGIRRASFLSYAVRAQLRARG